MRTHIHTAFLFLLALLAVASSCSKGGGSKPVLKINEIEKSTIAGDQVGFDINASGLSSITSLKVEEDYNGQGKKTMLDTTLASSKSVFTYVFRYNIPADAKKGESSTLYFTATDSKGNSTTVDRKIDITASQPKLSASADVQSGKPGTNIPIHVTINSVEPNIGSVVIQESINAQNSHDIASQDWNGQSSVNWTYNYTIPSSAKIGDSIILFITASNSDGAQRYTTLTLQVL